jgi:hypothetical protein
MPMLNTAIDAGTGAATSGGRRPTVVGAPVSASPELADRPRRRSFSVQDKLRILADTDRAAKLVGSAPSCVVRVFTPLLSRIGAGNAPPERSVHWFPANAARRPASSTRSQPK